MRNTSPEKKMNRKYLAKLMKKLAPWKMKFRTIVNNELIMKIIRLQQLKRRLKN